MDRLSTALAIAALVVTSGARGAAPRVGYAQSQGYFKKGTRPTLYQPLNLLDAREATVWCSSSSDTLSEPLTFGFKGQARIDEIRVYTGNGSDDSAFQEFSRARKFTVRGPTSARSFTAADERGLQAFTFDPPLVGSFFTVEILDQYPAEDPESPVCVTNFVFYSEGTPLNGPWMTQRLKYDKHRAALLGTWFSGYDGAPNRFLSFFFDGTWRLTYEPYEGRPHAFGGTYSIRGSRVVLELPGTGKVSGKLSRSSSEGDDFAEPSQKRTLSFEGDAPEDFKAPYRDQR